MAQVMQQLSGISSSHRIIRIISWHRALWAPVAAMGDCSECQSFQWCWHLQVVLTTQVKLQVAPMKMGKKIPKRVKFDYTTKHEKKSTEVKPMHIETRLYCNKIVTVRLQTHLLEGDVSHIRLLNSLHSKLAAWHSLFQNCLCYLHSTRRCLSVTSLASSGMNNNDFFLDLILLMGR